MRGVGLQRVVLKSGAVPIERWTGRKMGAETRGAEGDDIGGRGGVGWGGLGRLWLRIFIGVRLCFARGEVSATIGKRGVLWESL
jgi:hypothetical protein